MKKISNSILVGARPRSSSKIGMSSDRSILVSPSICKSPQARRQIAHDCSAHPGTLIIMGREKAAQTRGLQLAHDGIAHDGMLRSSATYSPPSTCTWHPLLHVPACQESTCRQAAVELLPSLCNANSSSKRSGVMDAKAMSRLAGCERCRSA